MGQEQLNADANTLQIYMQKEHRIDAKAVGVIVDLFTAHILVVVEIPHIHIL